MKSFIEPLESRIAPATLAISPVSVSHQEGDVDNTISFHVHLELGAGESPLTTDTTVQYSTVAGSAQETTDFTAATSTLTFAAGETDKDFTIQVKGNDLVQADRSFSVQLSNPTNSVTLKANEAVSTINIIDDDGEVILTALTPQVTEGNTGAANFADFTVSLAGNTPLSHDVVVNISYIDGTAKSVGAGKDYDASVTQVTIPAGQLSAPLRVNIVGDENLGGDEKFTVAIGSVTGANAGSTTSAEITILNDDDTVATPRVSLTGPGGNVAEGTNAVFTVHLDDFASESDIVVNYTAGLAGDTATSGTDYTAPTGTVTIPSGARSVTLPIAVLQDGLAEHLSESFSVKLNTATAQNNNGSIDITTDTAVATIAADADPLISVGDLTFAEGNDGTKTATFNLTLSSAADRDITVAYTTAAHTSGGFSATEGVDYAGTSGTITFLAGQTTAHVDVTINSDTAPEADEKFDFVLSNAGNGNLGGAEKIVTATIQNDDTLYSIVNPNDPASSAVTVGEAGGTVTFKVTRNDGSVPGTVHVTTRNGVDGTGIRGSESGKDFTTYDQDVVFAVGETEKTVTIELKEDDVYEGVERFTVELSAPTNGLLDPAHNVGTVTLNDNDAAPVVTLTSAQGTEGAALEFNVTLSRASELPVKVSYYTTDGVTAGNVFGASANDYTGVPQATPATLTIPANTTTAKISIATTQDLAVERDEVFSVTLSSVENGTLSATPTATGTILNNDTGVVHVKSVSSASILEGSDPTAPKMLEFTIELDRPIDTNFPLMFSTVDGTGANAAIGGLGGQGDYTTQTDVKVTIPADHLTRTDGKYFVTVSVPINGDRLAEGDETFGIKLSTTAANADKVVFDQSTGTGTILNDDLGIHVTDVKVREGDSGQTTAVFTISLDRALTAGQTVTMKYKTEDGTATSGGTTLGTGVKDYEAIGTLQTLTFDSTHSFGTVAVTVYGDKVSEGLDLSRLYETFTLKLSDAQLTTSAGNTILTLTDSEAEAQIIDDEKTYTSVVSVTPVSETQVEGDAAGTAHFKANLTTALQHDVLVKYSYSVITMGGSGETKTGQVTIPAGSLSAPIDIAYAGDETIRRDSIAQVTITEATRVLPAGQTEVVEVFKSTKTSELNAQTIILDDDAVVKIVAPADVAEGAAGTSHVVNYTFSLVDRNGAALTTPLDHDVVITYSTADGTATAGSDYRAIASGTKLTIPKASTTGSFTVPVTVFGDSVAGDDETFTVNATAVTGAHLATTPTSVTTKILNDDGALPKVVVNSVSGDEGANLIFTVRLVDANGNTVAADSDLTVKFHTTNGTATATADYTAVAANTTAGTVTISAGSTGAQFAVATATTETQIDPSTGQPRVGTNGQPIQFHANEGAETFNIVVDSAKYASSDANVDPSRITGGVGTINASDRPTLLIDSSTLRLTEGDSGAADRKITVRLAGDAVAFNAIPFTITTSNGTAIAGTDYTALTNATFSIPAGASSVEVPISVFGNTALEHDQTFTVTLNLPANANALLPQNQPITATAVIADDEITYSIHKDGDPASAAVQVDETGGFAIFKVTRNDTSIRSTVHFSTVEGTAKVGLDFRAFSGDLVFEQGIADATIKIPIIDDHRYEGAETFTVKLSNPSDGVVASQGTGTVTINDNETVPVVTIANTKEVIEGNTGVKKVTFTVKLSQENDAQDVVVRYSTSDISTTTGVFSATAGEDYTAVTNAAVTIPKGQLSATFTIDVLSDNRFDSGTREQFAVNLSFTDPATAGASFGGPTQISARGTIVDDDPLPVITVSAASATEGANLGFTVSLDRPSDLPIHLLSYTTNGTATAGLDFTGFTKTAQQPLDFAKGETSRQIVISTANDNVAEGDETFQLHVSKAPGTFPAKLNPKSTNLTGTILDDDHAFVTIGDLQIQEGDSGTTDAVFHVNLSSVASKDVLVKYTTVDGTATGGTDFIARTGTLVIPAGSTSGDIIIPVRGDLAQETFTDSSGVSHPAETFQVKLTSATNAEIALATGKATINDSEDTGATLNVANVQAAEGTPTGARDTSFNTLVFAPTLTKAASGDVTFTMSTAALQAVTGGAQFGKDYGFVLPTGIESLSDLTFVIKQGQTQVTKYVDANDPTHAEIDLPSHGLTVKTVKDGVFEYTESFLVKLNNVTGAIAGDTTATGTIYNDDLSVTARTVKWVDADGELVTLTSSRGNLTHAGFSFDTTTAAVTKYGGRTLQLLNLNAQEFLGANISITSRPQPGFPASLPNLTQDNLVNVGTIRSNNLTSTDDLLELTGVDLGKVTIQGDLGSIVVGDIYNDSALQLLSVKSFGVIKPGQTSLAIGNIERLNVAGDFMGNLQVKGNKDGSINHLRIGGLIDGTGLDPKNPKAVVGAITVKGAIRDAIVGGLEGGSVDGSGSISASSAFGKIVALTVKGDVIGGTGVGTGEIFSSNNIEALIINGSVIAGTEDQSGFIFAGNKIGTLRIDGNLSNNTTLLNPTVTGLKPGAAINSTAATDLAGNGESGSIAAGSMGSVKIGGSVIGGRIIATGSIGALTVDGDVKASTNGLNEAYIIAGGLNAEVALPSILVKGQAASAHVLAGYFRDIESELRDDPDSTDPLDKISVSRTFYTPANADAQIGTIEFDGAVKNINIVAGTMPGSFLHPDDVTPDDGSELAPRPYGDGLFGTGDDRVIKDVNTGVGLIDQATVSSRIAQIIFKGGILTDDVAHGIVAQQIGSVTINGDLQPLVGSNDPVEIIAGTKFYYHKVL